MNPTPWNELSEERKAEARAYAAQTLTITIDELGERLATAFADWLIVRRGPEGMEIPELKEHLRRLPNARWLSVYCFNREEAYKLLRMGALDVDTAPDPYADT